MVLMHFLLFRTMIPKIPQNVEPLFISLWRCFSFIHSSKLLYPHLAYSEYRNVTVSYPPAGISQDAHLFLSFSRFLFPFPSLYSSPFFQESSRQPLSWSAACRVYCWPPSRTEELVGVGLLQAADYVFAQKKVTAFGSSTCRDTSDFYYY